MNTVSALAVFLVAAVGGAWADPPSSGPTAGPPMSSWGPSWLSGMHLTRPQKLDKSFVSATIAKDHSPDGVTVGMWADADVQKGDQYQLMYQLRVQTRKGEFGPILGTTEMPNGITYAVAMATAGANWNGLEGTATISRQNLTGMTHLPTGRLVPIRVEPQLFDRTAGKFVTPGKTRAVIILADVDTSGRVKSVTSLPKWIEANAQGHPEEVLAVFNEMDEYDQDGNKVGEAFAGVLNNKDIPTPTRVRFIQAVPPIVVNLKHPVLWEALRTLAAGADPDLKRAAEAKLAEAK